MHPRYLVDHEAVAALTAYQYWRAGGFGGGALPAAGGVMEQAACTIEAFAIIGEAWATLERKDKANG